MKCIVAVVLFLGTASSFSHGELPYAEPLPGRPGYVRSPYQPDGIVDVRGYARGAQARDPFTSRFFLVPFTTSQPSKKRSSFGKRWDPKTAVADARRDIAANRIRFAYVGGFAPHAPGLPPAARARIGGYPRLKVGPQGCIQDDDFELRDGYAAQYNAAMWEYVSHKL